MPGGNAERRPALAEACGDDEFGRGARHGKCRPGAHCGQACHPGLRLSRERHG